MCNKIRKIEVGVSGQNFYWNYIDKTKGFGDSDKTSKTKEANILNSGRLLNFHFFSYTDLTA